MSGAGDPDNAGSESGGRGGGSEGVVAGKEHISPWSAEFEFVSESERQAPIGGDWTARPPAADAPIEFAAPRLRGIGSPAHTSPTHASPAHTPPGGGGPSGHESSGPSRRRWLVGIVALTAVAAVMVVAVVAVATRGGEPADEPVAGGSDVGATLPDASPDTTLPEVATVPRSAVDEIGEAGEIIEIALPPDVAAIDKPTEIVMTNGDGQVHTLSLPSGRVRTVDLDVTDNPGALSGAVVAPDAAVFSIDPSGMVIVPRAGPPLEVEASSFGGQVADASISPNGWYRGSNGSSVFDVTVYSSDDSVRYSVDVQGRATAVAGPVQYPYLPYEVVSADGARILNEPGGAYEVAPDGSARRIDDGWVVAATGDHRLVRTCDETLACLIELVTVSTGMRTVIDPETLPDDFGQPYSVMTLSPDGRAVAVLRERQTPERGLVVLGVGETVTYPASWVSRSAAWAADGSGVFDSAVPLGGEPRSGLDVLDEGAGTGLRFTSVASGESVVFGEELGAIVSLGVRWPEAEIDTASPIVTTRDVAPASPVGPTGITLLAATRVGTLSVLDVDAAAARTWDVGQRLGSRTSTLFGADEGVVVLPDSGGGAFVSTPTVERALSDAFGVEGVKLPGPDPHTVWVPSNNGRDGDVDYVLLPLTATSQDEALATISVADAELLGGDGAGGLVVARGGDVFIADVAGTTRLTAGELIAISADTAYVRECDDVAQCTLVRVDRVSGQRIALESSAGLEADINNVDLGETVAGRGAALATSIAPGAEVLVAQVRVVSEDDGGTASSEMTWAFVDLLDGTITAIDDYDDSQPVVWSGDGRFAAVRSGVEVHVYDRAGGRMVPLDMEPVVAIGPAPLIDIGR